MRKKRTSPPWVMCLVFVAVLLFVFADSEQSAAEARLDETSYTERMDIEPLTLNETSVDDLSVPASDVIVFADGSVLTEQLAENTEFSAPSHPEQPTPDEIAIAQTVWGEARGCDKKGQAAVVWCIMNRYDAGYGSIVQIVSAPQAFLGYSPKYPVTDEILELVRDVMWRWGREQNGETDVGRVLPKEYRYFFGTGTENVFTTIYNGRGDRWDWSLPDPYIENASSNNQM